MANIKRKYSIFASFDLYLRVNAQ